MGLQPGQLQAVLLTHFHSDHIDGLGELATLRWAGGGWRQPLPVFPCWARYPDPSTRS